MPTATLPPAWAWGAVTTVTVAGSSGVTTFSRYPTDVKRSGSSLHGTVSSQEPSGAIVAW